MPTPQRTMDRGPERHTARTASTASTARPSRTGSNRRRETQPLWPLALLAIIALLAVASIVNGAVRCSASTSGEPAQLGQAASTTAEPSSGNGDGAPEHAATATAGGVPAEGRVSFVAVGDNVPNDVLGEYADACSGDPDDGTYDYTPLFAQVKPYIQAADLAYIDQETHVGGNDLGPSGYPSFNTTDEMADAVVDAGFDLVASATNHSYDWGAFGAIEHSRSVWNALPVAFTGTAANDEEATEIPVVERNGITFSLLNYTYGVNGYTQDELPGYAVNFIDEDRIRDDVARARASSDVVIAAMHWGTENETEPDADERRYAQLLADLGVDIVLGSHPHVVQPLTWITGENGNRTLVAYSLGNFIIQHADPTHDNDLEGMLACDFVRVGEGSAQAGTGITAGLEADGANGTLVGTILARLRAASAEADSGYTNERGITIQNVRWIPLVYHGEEGAYAVWPLKDYPESLARKNPAYTDLDDPIAWLRQESANIVNAEGNAFPIDW